MKITARIGTAVALSATLLSGAAIAQDKITVGFLPGVVDPFYQVMEIGVKAAAADLGLNVVTQIPPTWGVEVQTPILDAMVARADRLVVMHRGRKVTEKKITETNSEEVVQYMVGALDDTNETVEVA